MKIIVKSEHISIWDIARKINKNISCEMDWLAEFTKFISESPKSFKIALKEFATKHSEAREWLETEGFIKIEEEKIYHTGQRFKNGGEIYILTATGPDIKVALISLSETTSNRWNDPIQVKNVQGISETEFKRISEGGKFTLIN